MSDEIVSDCAPTGPRRKARAQGTAGVFLVAWRRKNIQVPHPKPSVAKQSSPTLHEDGEITFGTNTAPKHHSHNDGNRGSSLSPYCRCTSARCVHEVSCSVWPCHGVVALDSSAMEEHTPEEVRVVDRAQHCCCHSNVRVDVFQSCNSEVWCMW